MPRPRRSSRLVIVALRYASLAETIFRSGVRIRNRPGSDSKRLCNTARLRRSSSSHSLPLADVARDGGGRYDTPREFLMGETVSATSISVPSFLRRTVSSLIISPRWSLA